MSKREERRVKARAMLDIMDMLVAPIIVPKCQWYLDLPERLIEDVTLSRLIAAMKGEEKATWAEVTAYLMPVSMEGPMQYEWSNIYLYASAQYIRECRPEQAASVEFAPDTLNDYEMMLLERLRRRIYIQRRKVVKQQIRQAERQGRTEEGSVEIIQEELPLMPK